MKNDHTRARFDRQFRKMAPLLPGMTGLRKPGWIIARVIIALLLIIGGVLSILPVLNVWMLPLGLLLLAIDVPVLQGPVAALVICGRRRISILRRRWRR